jgi:hypothetical protein
VKLPFSRKPKPAPERTDFAILVGERADGSLSLLVRVTRRGLKLREEKSVFTITDRLDPRLEGYLREMADAARARRLSTKRALRKQRIVAESPAQLELIP